jgi:16S rRNA (cytosine1402-N4)-methyltransferase
MTSPLVSDLAGHAPDHVPVLLAEVMDALRPGPGHTLIDGTFGAGGYSRAFLAAGAKVIAFDRDPSAEVFAQALAAEPGFRFVLAPFAAMETALGGERVDGIALDLGLSSMQLDQAERGFSLMRDGPLDMRMSGEGVTAADLVNHETPEALARIFFVYGEERQSRRIARALERRRAETPFMRTLDLAEVVERALGGRRGAKIHPATRVFQALRIAVNQELIELEGGLAAAERTLKSGGRLAVVTFHSLEDRIVKSFLYPRCGRVSETSRHAPPRAKGPAPSFELLFNGVRAPGAAEVAANPRARSAKLRCAVRTDAASWDLAA